MDGPDEDINSIIDNLNKAAPANHSIHAEKLTLFLKKMNISNPGCTLNFKNAVQICR